MTNVDFGQFGRNIAVNVPVNVIDLRCGKEPVVILLSEKHNDNVTIADNIETTVGLLDAGIICQVFVEEFFSGDVRQQVENECRKLYKCENLQERHEQVRRDYGSDAEVLAAMRSDTDRKLSFARWLLFLRPNASVICVECPDLKQEADRVAEAIGSEPAQETNPEAERIRKILKARRHDVHRRREQAFFSTAIYHTSSSTFAIAINAGGYHNPYLLRYAERDGVGCILTQPPTYTDEVSRG